MVLYFMEDMFTRVHYIFCRDFPKGWLRVTLKGIWCHREHSVKSKRTLYSFISFRFVKLVLPRGHKSRRRKCFPEHNSKLIFFSFFSFTLHLHLCMLENPSSFCQGPGTRIGFKNSKPQQFHSFQSVLSFMHFHEVGQCVLINFGLYSFMRKLIFRAAKQAKHTWYFSRKCNLRPSNIFESESIFTTKVFSRQGENFIFD